MTKGIILFAFGRRGYAYMAYNLAMSIKRYNKNINITLYIDEKLLDYISHDLEFFDNVNTLPASVIYRERTGIDPASVKINIPRFLPYDENLYLDVDGIALKDLQPLINTLSKKEGYYLTQVVSKGKYNEHIDYNIWSTKDKVWDFFDLNKEESIYYAVQSSFAYFKKGKDLESFYKVLKGYYDKGFLKSDIKQRWGGTLPDEMFFGAVCGNLNYNPDSELTPIFFGNKKNVKSHEDIKKEYYISAIYGNGKGNTLTASTYFHFYDDQMSEVCKEMGREFLYNHKVLMIDKHANF